MDKEQRFRGTYQQTAFWIMCQTGVNKMDIEIKQDKQLSQVEQREEKNGDQGKVEKKSIGEWICRNYTYPKKPKFELEKEKKVKRESG